MIYVMGIGPGDPELLTVKAARLLREADIVYVPQSNSDSRSVAETIVAPYVDAAKIRHTVIFMNSPERGIDPAYAELAKDMAAESRQGRTVVYANIGDTLLFSTGQYLGRELTSLGAKYAYVSGIPSFVAAAGVAGIPLATGLEGLMVAAMPGSLENLDACAACAETMVLMKVNKRLPILLEYVRTRKPGKAVLLYRIGLEGERIFDLTTVQNMPEDIGYLSTAILSRKG